MESENRVADILKGTVGALIGALIGMGVFLLLGRLGYISMAAGAVAILAIFGGYYLLAKDFSVPGLVICAVILIATVYISNRLDWAISISKELKKYGSDYDEFTVSYCYKNISTLLELAESKGSYIKNLVLSYLFTLGGGVFIVAKAGKK